MNLMIDLIISSWSVGMARSYESPLSRAVAEQKYTKGVKGNDNCEAPDDAFFCFMFGIGYVLLVIDMALCRKKFIGMHHSVLC